MADLQEMYYQSSPLQHPVSIGTGRFNRYHEIREPGEEPTIVLITLITDVQNMSSPFYTPTNGTFRLPMHTLSRLSKETMMTTDMYRLLTVESQQVASEIESTVFGDVMRRYSPGPSTTYVAAWFKPDFSASVSALREEIAQIFLPCPHGMASSKWCDSCGGKKRQAPKRAAKVGRRRG